MSALKNGAILIDAGVQMRVLIAEDDTALTSFVRKSLEVEHYAVDVAADGEREGDGHRIRL